VFPTKNAQAVPGNHNAAELLATLVKLFQVTIMQLPLWWSCSSVMEAFKVNWNSQHMVNNTLLWITQARNSNLSITTGICICAIGGKGKMFMHIAPLQHWATNQECYKRPTYYAPPTFCPITDRTA